MPRKAKATVLTPGNGVPTRREPSLTEISCQLEDVFAGMMAGQIPVNVVDKAIKLKRTQMRPAELRMQAARMDPRLRAFLPAMLGLPEPEQNRLDKFPGVAV